MVKVKSYGTSVHLICECCKKGKQKHIFEVKPIVSIDKKEERLQRVQFHNYQSNYLQVIGLLDNGLGYKSSKSMFGYMGVKSPWSKKTYRKLESAICSELIEKVNILVEKNLKAEIDASPNTIGTYPYTKELIVSFDMGWRQRNDSNAGHAFVFGKNTKKIIGYTLLIRKCAFCTSYCKKNNLNIEMINRNLMIPDHICPYNHKDSAKSMEGEAAVIILEKIYTKYGYPICGIVADDDSTF